MKKLLLALITVISVSSCSELQQVAKTILVENQPLTSSEISAGLRQALTVGVDSSVSQLADINGYLADETVKILLPEEAQVVTENIAKLPGGQELVDKVITGINRAASDAAKEATPILVNSIKTMSIQDAAGILAGGDYAATEYLKAKNYDQLVSLYQPKIESSLQKDLVAGYSAQESWDQLTGNWNKVANSFIGQMADLKPVETDLSAYLTKKAMDGLFLKIGEAEKDIREDPAARVTELLKRVFGS